jgi:hypothetical protein
MTEISNEYDPNGTTLSEKHVIQLTFSLRERHFSPTRHCEERSDVAIQTAAWIATSLRSSQ